MVFARKNTPQPQPVACFTRQQRLLAPADFKRVFARACKAGNSQLTVLVRQNGLAHARLGMAISRKAIKRAVQRNLLKRLLREYFRQHHPSWPGVDLVVMAKPAAAMQSKPVLQQNIQHLFRQMTRLCADQFVITPGPDTSPHCE